MITIVTNTTSVIELTAYPFTGTVTRRGKEIAVLEIPCGPSMSLESVKETFSDEASTVSMILMDGGSEVRRFEDYTKIEEISWVPEYTDDEGNQVPGNYIAKMSQKLTFEEDLLIMKKTMAEIRKDAATAAEEKAKQDGAIERLEKTAAEISNTVQGIQKSMSGIDPSTLELPELKEYLIGRSKEELASYLETHPISSSVHGGTAKLYSITAEKQNYLMAMIMMASNMEEARLAGMKKFYDTQYAGKSDISFEDFVAGIDNGTISVGGVTFNKYQPSWNSVGEPCTYDWTINELKQLAAEIEAAVRPLVSKQQTMEVEIKAAKTIEEANAVSLSFASTPKVQ